MSGKNEKESSMGRGEKLWSEIPCWALRLHRWLRLLLHTSALKCWFSRHEGDRYVAFYPTAFHFLLKYYSPFFWWWSQLWVVNIWPEQNKSASALRFCLNHQEEGPPYLWRHTTVMVTWAKRCFWKYLLENEVITEKSWVKRWIEWSCVSMKLTSWSQLSLPLTHLWTFWLHWWFSQGGTWSKSSPSSSTRELVRSASPHTLTKAYWSRTSGAWAQ